MKDIASLLAQPVEFAPLTQAYVALLVNYMRRSVSRDAGRPRKSEAQQQLVTSIDELYRQVQEKRQQIYNLVDPVVRSGDLTTGWVLNTLNLYMPKGTLYPQRLSEWRQANLLFYNARGRPDPNCVCCLLLARTLNPNRTGWLPRPTRNEGYWIWRQDARNLDPYSYELPVISIDPQDPSIIKRLPPVKEQAYVLFTSWYGVVWDDEEAWLITDDIAIRWVGDVSNEEAVKWLKPHEHSALAEMPPEESIPRRVLRILARERLAHTH